MTTETRIDTGTDEVLCAIRDRVTILPLNRSEARDATTTPFVYRTMKAAT